LLFFLLLESEINFIDCLQRCAMQTSRDQQQNWTGAKHNLPIRLFSANLASTWKGVLGGSHFAKLRCIQLPDHRRTL